MIEIEINGKKYKAQCPVRVIHEGKEFFIKRATKTNGIYLNDQPLKEKDVLLRQSDNIHKPDAV